MNHTKLARREIKRRLKEAGITHREVAAEAGVGTSGVSHVLSGRLQSANIVEAALRLLTNGAARKSA